MSLQFEPGDDLVFQLESGFGLLRVLAVARLGNRPVRDEELAAYRDWQRRGGRVHERSALLLLGLR
jgi:hypothetical protein